jgi:hypothetical protein
MRLYLLAAFLLGFGAALLLAATLEEEDGRL